MRKIRYTQTATGTWAADSAGISTDIDRTGLITRIDATVDITPSATLAAANQPDGVRRIVQNLRIEGGSTTYITLPADDACMGGTLLHYMNQADGFGVGFGTMRITNPSRTFMSMNYVLHMGGRNRDPYGRDNPFDLSAFIPATRESQLRAVWVTSGNDVMDDTVTVSSATIRYTLSVVQGTEGELRNEMARQGVSVPAYPAWTAEVFAHTATSSDYSTERDVPTGGFLKRISIAEQDDTATRSLRAQDQATAFAVKLVQQNENIVRVFGDHLTSHLPPGGVFQEADDAITNGGPLGYPPRGIFLIDLRPHATSHPDLGLDLRNVQTGAVKLGMTVTLYTAGDDSLILYERYSPHIGALAAN